MNTKQFNVRVYGICELNSQFLITDEVIDGHRMTKLVGGGLEWGEGLVDAIKREFREECEANVIETSHFYTTDFFQQSAFRIEDQLISIYYLVRLEHPERINVVQKPFAKIVGNGQCFRWVNREDLRSADFTFPIDQKVIEMLLLT
ncbi:MAG: NUDIX domain-containing protein [Flavobacteriales bacterium]|nr:NUDIX domain-containing protein [Flavobacteriales bacterium]